MKNKTKKKLAKKLEKLEKLKWAATSASRTPIIDIEWSEVIGSRDQCELSIKESKIPIRCDSCPTYKNVIITWCPYQLDLYNEKKQINICPYCYNQKCGDI